ncbi:MAG: BamA/TamA family outer membrane protein [Saprospiraceae bacterium]
MRSLSLIFFVGIGFLFTACDATKYIAEDELLYTGTNVKLENPKQFSKAKTVVTDLNIIAEPKANTSSFSVWVYNTFRKEKGISGFIRSRLGEPATTYNTGLVSRSELRMEDYLFDRGYFGAEIKFDTLVDGKTVMVEYSITSKGQYKIRNINLPQDSTKIGELVQNNQKKSKLKSGKFYNVNDLAAERVRLNQIAKNEGFYDFNPDYFYYFADTTAGDLQADLFLRIKPPADSTKHQQYYIGETYIFPQYSLNDPNADYVDTVKTERVTIYQSEEAFLRPSALEETIAQNAGELFAERRQEQTINQLLDLGVFKFVNLKYRLRQSLADRQLYLDRYLYLTPSLTQDFSTGIEFSSDNSRNLGATATVNYANRNLFNGAERLNLGLSVGAETQSGSQTFINTLDVNANAELVFPRFITPFGIRNTSTFYVPRTRISLSENYQQRPDFYTLNSAELRYTFDWRETTFKRHELTVFNLNLVNLLSTTDEFQALLDSDRRLASSFDDLLILGFAYRYTYTNQRVNTSDNYLYWQTRAETSGNIVNGVSALFGGGSNATGEPEKLLNLPYSQFAKLETDARYNILQRNSSIVARLNVGAGLPYGNSDYLPYIKQFFSGGANSVRAFRIRELGPGTTQPLIQGDERPVGFFDQTGDVKIEMNLEYRFDILPAFYLKGAAFVDAGNVWLITDKNNENPNGLFRWNSFYKELAVGAGLGLRLDINFIVLRFDAAYPLRLPYLPDGERWVFSDYPVEFQDRFNLNYNIAIGYPF